MEIQLESSLPLVPAARLILSITKYRDWKLNFLQLDEIWRGEAGYSRLDKSFASTAYDIFFVFFFPPLLSRRWRAYAAVDRPPLDVPLYFSFSLSLSISSNTPPLENPAVLVCVFEKYFSLVRFDYGSRVIPRVASAITKIHRIRDAG